MLQVLKPVHPGVQQWEACELQLESISHLLQLEKPCTQQQRPSTANKIFFFNHFFKLNFGYFINLIYMVIFIIL